MKETSNTRKPLMRLLIWSCCMLVSVAGFCLILGGLLRSLQILLFALRFSLILIGPVWLLSVPVILVASHRPKVNAGLVRTFGAFIGPAAIGVWCMIAQAKNGNARQIWFGDPLLGIGGIVLMILACILGSVAAQLFLMALRRFEATAATEVEAI